MGQCFSSIMNQHVLLFVFCEFQVDPALIGGMVVDVSDKHIDMSMATKIKNITNTLRGGL